MKNFFKNKKAFILFSILGIALVIIVIIIPLIAWSANEYNWTTRSYKALRALNIADAGAELAIWEIVHNNASFAGWSGADPKTLTLASFTDNAGEAIGDISISTDNTAPDEYFIISTGLVPHPSLNVTKTVKVEVFPHPLFNNGIFGNTSVTTRGSTTIDSYDSSDGPYSPITANDQSDVGTNGGLSLEGDAVINGDIFVGPDGGVSGSIGDHVNGEDYYQGKEVELDEAPFDSSYFISLPSLGNLDLAGFNDQTIPPGDYRYESISITAHANLTISSNTRIYVHNDFYIGGQATVFTYEGVEIFIGGDGTFAGQGIVNTTSLSSNLLIYGIGSGTTLSYTGGSDFYGAIYAPESDIYMAGDANVYGSVIGNTVDLAGGIQFHYDEALTRSGPFVGYDIAYWQED